MSHYLSPMLPFAPLYPGLVSDPSAKHYLRMRQAIWLYLYLMTQCHSKTGVVVTRCSTIAQHMGIAEATIRSWLGHLEKGQYVSTKRQGDTIIFKIAKWKSPTQETLSNIIQEPPQSPKKSVAKRKKAAQKELPFPDGAEAVAKVITDKFQETDALKRITHLCQKMPQGAIERAYTKARSIPSSRIKKSRSALFIYLTKTYAQEI